MLPPFALFRPSAVLSFAGRATLMLSSPDPVPSFVATSLLTVCHPFPLTQCFLLVIVFVIAVFCLSPLSAFFPFLYIHFLSSISHYSCLYCTSGLCSLSILAPGGGWVWLWSHPDLLGMTVDEQCQTLSTRARQSCSRNLIRPHGRSTALASTPASLFEVLGLYTSRKSWVATKKHW